MQRQELSQRLVGVLRQNVQVLTVQRYTARGQQDIEAQVLLIARCQCRIEHGLSVGGIAGGRKGRQQRNGLGNTKLLVGLVGNLKRFADMLRRALTSFVERDDATARVICDEDDAIDALYDQTYHALIQEMVRSPDDIQDITFLIWTCHNLERIADRVTNICERVIFMVTGQLEEINVSRY